MLAEPPQWLVPLTTWAQASVCKSLKTTNFLTIAAGQGVIISLYCRNGVNIVRVKSALLPVVRSAQLLQIVACKLSLAEAEASAMFHVLSKTVKTVTSAWFSISGVAFGNVAVSQHF